jgi:hypothetical protein
MFSILVVVAALVPSDLPFTTILQGHQSQTSAAHEAVVRTEREWGDLWESKVGRGERPDVDFSTRMLAAVFLGTRSTAGYAVEITRTYEREGTLVVEYVERQPPPGMMVAQVITSPFHVVSLPRHEGPVEFHCVKGEEGDAQDFRQAKTVRPACPLFRFTRFTARRQS